MVRSACEMEKQSPFESSALFRITSIANHNSDFDLYERLHPNLVDEKYPLHHLKICWCFLGITCSFLAYSDSLPWSWKLQMDWLFSCVGRLWVFIGNVHYFWFASRSTNRGHYPHQFFKDHLRGTYSCTAFPYVGAIPPRKPWLDFVLSVIVIRGYRMVIQH